MSDLSPTLRTPTKEGDHSSPRTLFRIGAAEANGVSNRAPSREAAASGLGLRQVSFAYGRDARGFQLRDVTLDVAAGEMVALLGPNGSGKTTLVKLGAGTLRPTSGAVSALGHPVGSYSRRALARVLAVVPQETHLPFAFTVREVVALGRTAHLPPFGGERPADGDAIARALDAVGLSEKASHLFSQLSGGERRRAILALALAQEPKLLLLDEPTAHLDVAAQVEVLELVSAWNRERGVTVLAAVHDLNLAALYFPRLVLLERGRIVADGRPEAVIRPDLIRRVYGAEVRVERHPTRPVPHAVVLPRDGLLGSSGQ